MSTDNKLRLFEGKEALFIYKSIIQYAMAKKSTRLVYTDENNLNIYRSLPEKDFKEFMMAYLTYKKGDDIDSMFTSLTAKLLFMSIKDKIEYNEDKWEKQAQARRENGKKGGRPKKIDIEPNNEFENESPNKIPSVQFEEIQKEEDFQKDFENAVNQVVEVAAKQEQSLFSEVLQDLSSKLSAQYNKEYDGIRKLLYETAKEKSKRNKELKEVG